MTTDPIADMLARIRNGQKAEHETVDMPTSKLKLEVARILADEGYIASYESLSPETGHPKLRVTLKYGHDRSAAISGMRRISTPGRRVYARAGNLPRVLGGLGTAILSTSSGVMSDRQAARAGVGGEVVAYVW